MYCVDKTVSPHLQFILEKSNMDSILLNILMHKINRILYIYARRKLFCFDAYINKIDKINSNVMRDRK